LRYGTGFPNEQDENRDRQSWPNSLRCVDMAFAAERTATTLAIERAKIHWQQLNALKRSIIAQMGELEDLEQDATP